MVAEAVVRGQRGVVVLGRPDQRSAAGPAPHHARGERLLCGGVAAAVGAACLRVEVVPEGLDVLAELPEDQVAAVAPEVRAALRGAGQHADGVVAGRQQRAVRQQPVLVGVAEDELPGPDHLFTVRAPVTGRERRLGQPLDEGLGDAVAEAEGLTVGQLGGAQPRGLGERAGDQDLPARLGLQLPQPLPVARVEHHQDVHRRAGRAAPPPVPGGVLPDVPEEAAAIGVGHAYDELVRESVQSGGLQSQASQAVRGEGHVDGGVRGAGEAVRHAGRQPPQRGPGGGRRPGGGEHQEAGRRQGAVAAGDQALDVVEFQWRRHGVTLPSGLQNRASQASVSAGPRSPKRPARMRALVSRSCAVDVSYAEYQTCVGTWWHRR
ncbi:hypothetical protein SCANM63S_04369 [Streptomyces canarius]